MCLNGGFFSALQEEHEKEVENNRIQRIADRAVRKRIERSSIDDAAMKFTEAPSLMTGSQRGSVEKTAWKTKKFKSLAAKKDFLSLVKKTQTKEEVIVMDDGRFQIEDLLCIIGQLQKNHTQAGEVDIGKVRQRIG